MLLFSTCVFGIFGTLLAPLVLKTGEHHDGEAVAHSSQQHQIMDVAFRFYTKVGVASSRFGIHVCVRLGRGSQTISSRCKSVDLDYIKRRQLLLLQIKDDI